MRKKRILLGLLVLGGLVLLAGSAGAQVGPPAPSSGGIPAISLSIGGKKGPQAMSSALEMVLIITALTFAPALLLTVTSFTRIVVVLSFLKRATTVQEMPPSQVTVGIAIFLTIFVMAPTFSAINEHALKPYSEGKMGFFEAAQVAGKDLSRFLLRQTHEEDLQLVYEISHAKPPATAEDVPFHLLVPAFVLSELKTAFQMGFLLYLPFLVIDIVIASILISMGMFTLPPVIISTPFKILLFLLVDGWGLVIRSLTQSFFTT
ncbi:MAG TPA: flagellar biosynthesis protein FliP [Planctomycetes bacterium]|nr:flagellar biosynthesis protein FliP [Planctomycetota bacterium]